MQTALSNISNEIAPLACHQLYKSYEGTMVLNGLSLSVPQGAVMGLIGRNGAGKSTLIRILLGLTQPASGQSSLLGEPSLHLSDKIKARLSYVPQQPDALNWMRVGDMLDFIGSCYPRWDAKYVDDALSRWWISKDKRLSVLSPGERQRVALIRALASQPELLVLDEPASALDPVARRDLLREIAQRAGDVGTTVLFSTHIVSDLERVASHVAFLHAGKLLLNTTMDELKETHARLTLTRDALQQVHGLLPGEIVRHIHKDGSARIVLSREPNHSWPAITTHAGATLDVLSLEDLFIEVAG